jgi:hypothetical protein
MIFVARGGVKRGTPAAPHGHGQRLVSRGCGEEKIAVAGSRAGWCEALLPSWARGGVVGSGPAR